MISRVVLTPAKMESPSPSLDLRNHHHRSDKLHPIRHTKIDKTRAVLTFAMSIKTVRSLDELEEPLALK